MQRQFASIDVLLVLSLALVLALCSAFAAATEAAATGSAGNTTSIGTLTTCLQVRHKHGYLKNDAHRGSDSPLRQRNVNREVLDYWTKALPWTAMPGAIKTLVSPLSRRQVRSYKKALKVGRLADNARAASAFCSSARLVCGSHLPAHLTKAARGAMGGAHFELHSVSASHTQCGSRFVYRKPRSSLLPAAGGGVDKLSRDVEHETRGVLSDWFLESDLLAGTPAAAAGTSAAHGKAAAASPMEVPAELFSEDKQLRLLMDRSFLPRELASIVRLIQRELHNIMDQFHVPQDSPMASMMRDTVRFCSSSNRDSNSSSSGSARLNDVGGEDENEDDDDDDDDAAVSESAAAASQTQPGGGGAGGDDKSNGTCVTSLEDLVDLVGRLLFPNSTTPVQALSSTSVPPAPVEHRRRGRAGAWSGGGRFKVVRVEQRADARSGSHHLSCQPLVFPFHVLFCHRAPVTKLYSVTLQSAALPAVTVRNVVLCHMDTGGWGQDHDAVRVLGKAPPGGHTGVCHWSPPGSLAFVLAP